MKADSLTQRKKIIELLRNRGIDAELEYQTAAIYVSVGDKLYAFGTASGEDWGYNDDEGDVVGQLNLPVDEQSPKVIADRIAEVVQQNDLFGGTVASIKKEALEASEKFKLRANAARIKKAALDAVAAHEKQAAPLPGDPEDEQPEETTPEPPQPEPAEPEPTEVERTEPATDPAPLPVPPVEPPEMEVVPPPAPVEVPEETEEEEESGTAEMTVRTEVETEIDDPETVEAVMEFLHEEDYLDARLKFTEGVWGWREAANFCTVEIGTKEYMVAPTHDAAEKFALAMVRQQLTDEPELFTQDWLEGYIDDERLRDALSSDVEEQVRQDPDAYGWEPEEIEEYDDEEDEEADEHEPLMSEEPSDDWIEDKVQEILKDPVQYCKDLFGDADGMKFAFEHGGININEAAEDAVAADGPGHFLSSYDGELHELPGGGVYWRHN